MEKMMKRLLSLALAVALVLSMGLVPAKHVHAEGETVAQPSDKLTNYRWETTENGTALTNVTTDGYAANGFTENVGGTVAGRKLTQFYAELEETIILRPTDEWEIEWKATNSTGKNPSATTAPKGTGRILLCSGPKAAANGAQSVYLAEMYAMCQYGGPLYTGAYNQLGNKLASGHEGRSGVNTYTIKNVPGEDGAVIQLYVNGVYAMDLNKVYRTGSEKTDDASALANATYNFNYIGDADSWNLGSPEFHYLEIRNAHVHSGEWVAGEEGLTQTCVCGHVETAPFTAYRWEMNEEGTAVDSVATEGFYVENSLSGSTGTVSNGNLSGYKRIIENAVSMDHTKPWVIEWKAAGTWRGMLLSMTTAYSTTGNVFVYHPESGKPYTLGSKFEHPNNNTTAFWNYGFAEGKVAAAFTAAGKTFVESDVHTFRIENRISNGVSVWYLIIDEVEIGAMTNVYNGSKTGATFTNDTLLMQKDFSFGYIGATSKLLTADNFDYIEIWPNGEPVPAHECVFNIEKEVNAGADCQHPGTTVWACECGETETRPNEVYGQHDYYAETEGEPGEDCQHPGEDMFVCSICGDSYTAENGIPGEHSYKLISSTVGADCETAGVDTYECELCEDTYTEANEKFGDHSYGDWYHDGTCVLRTCTVCENHSETAKYSVEGTTDGVYYYFGYQDFAEALNAAPVGYNITLWADAQIDELRLTEGLYLNLNGHVLTTNAAVVNNGSQIYNAGLAETAYLKVPQGALILPSTPHELAIWNGVDGYIFEDCEKYQTLIETPRAGNTIFYFLPEMPEYVHDYLANGGATLKVRLSWTVEGQQVSRVVVASSELMSNFYAGYADGKYAYAFKLNVTGTDLIDEGSLEFEAFFESCGSEYVLIENT